MDTGLVLDIGNLESVALPVSDYRPLVNYAHSIDIAGSAISRNLCGLLESHAEVINDDGTKCKCDSSILGNIDIDDVKTRILYIPHVPPILVDGVYELADSVEIRCGCTRLNIPAWIREVGAQVLFDGDEDGRNLATIILDSVLKVLLYVDLVSL